MAKLGSLITSFALTLIAAVAPGIAYGQAETLTVSVWGGGYGEDWKKIVSDQYSVETGIKITVDLGPSTQRLTKLITTQGAGTDLFFITDHQMAVAKLRGILQPVDTRNVPNMANLHDVARDPLGDGVCPAVALLGVGLAYNKNVYATPPASWKELARRDLKVKPAFMDISFSVAPAVMVHFAEMNGGNINNMTPAFKMVAAQKDSAAFFKLFEVLDWINRGEVSVAPMLNTFVKKDPNVPLSFTFPKDGILGVVNMACIPKASRNKAAAEKFLNYYLSAAVQTRLAVAFGETPVVKNASIPANIPFELIPPARLSELKFYSPMVIARQRDAWIERFQEEIVAK
jgi:putative spermidine/putrescine transport system substrate-binding protein